MKSIRTTILILLLVQSASFCQTLSRDEAILLANKLAEKKILNEKGKALLVQKVRENGLWAPETPYSNVPNKLTKASVLAFCAQAFQAEFVYRFGGNSSPRKMKSEQRKMIKAQEKFKDDPAAFDEWLKNYYAKTNSIYTPADRRRMKIEETVPFEDSIIENTRTLPMTMSEMNGNLIHKSRSVLGKTRARTARDIFEIGLIDSRLFDEINSLLKDSTITTEENTLTFAAVKSHYNDSYPELKSRQIKLLDSLEANKLLNPAKKQLLVSSYKELELKSDLEILGALNNAIILHPDNLRDPVKHFSTAMEQVKSIVPDFDYSSLSIETDSTRDYDLIAYNVTVSFVANGIKYGHRFTYGFVNDDAEGRDESFDAFSIGDFYPAINKWLTDQNSPCRVYLAHARHSLSHDKYDIGLVLMTERQRRTWSQHDFEEMFTSEDHSNVFNTRYIRSAVQMFDSIGLFSHLSPFKLDSSKQGLAFRHVTSAVDILTAFPDVVFIFDWETANLENPYEEHCEMLSRISRGKFTPTNINDDFEGKLDKPKEAVSFSFDFNGKHYSAKLENNVDWMDPEFVDLISRALKENNVDGKFHHCYSGGQVSGYIFLTRAQEEVMRTRFPEVLTDESQR